MKKFGIALACLMSAVSVTALCACSDTKEAKKYTVTFDTHGGSAVASVKVRVGDKVKMPANPEKDMFRFDAWYKEVDMGSGKTTLVKYDFDSRMNAEDMTLHAVWIGTMNVRVDYDANGGSFGDGKEHYSIGAPNTELDVSTETPTRDGYVFGGWYTDPECLNEFTLSVFPVENATLYAGWDEDPAYAYISYYGNGELLKVDFVEKGEQVTVPQLFDPKISDSIVLGDWYEDAALTRKHTFGNASGNVSLYTSFYTSGLTFSGSTVTGYDGDATEVYVPTVYNGKQIDTIGEYAFYRSSELTNVTKINLPDTIKTLSEGAFYDCRYLTEINLSSRLQTIGDNAFYKNVRLKAIGDISSVRSIGAAAFIGCEMLTEIELSDGLTAIGAYAFSDCNMLTDIVIRGDVRTLPEYAFAGCKTLESVTLSSDALQSIGGYAFRDCPALKSVTIERTSGTVTIDNGQNPFAGSYNVTVYVPSDLLEEYKTNATNDSIKDKLAAIR